MGWWRKDGGAPLESQFCLLRILIYLGELVAGGRTVVSSGRIFILSCQFQDGRSLVVGFILSCWFQDGRSVDGTEQGSVGASSLV